MATKLTDQEKKERAARPAKAALVRAAPKMLDALLLADAVLWNLPHGDPRCFFNVHNHDDPRNQCLCGKTMARNAVQAVVWEVTEGKHRIPSPDVRLKLPQGKPITSNQDLVSLLGRLDEH